MKLFSIAARGELLVLLVLAIAILAGCAETPKKQSAEAASPAKEEATVAEKLPDILNVSEPKWEGESASVKAQVDCHSDEAAISLHFVYGNDQRQVGEEAACSKAMKEVGLSVGGIPPETKGKLEVRAVNSRGVRYRDWPVERKPVVSRGETQASATAPSAIWPKPKTTGPNMFGVGEAGKRACVNGWLQGRFEYYEPKYFGLRGKNLPDGKKILKAPLETDYCFPMLTVSGKQWVVQRKGIDFRWHAAPDGRPDPKQPVARDDCGNPADEGVPLTAALFPVQPKPMGSSGVGPTTTAEKPEWSAQKIAEQVTRVRKRVVILKDPLPPPADDSSGEMRRFLLGVGATVLGLGIAKALFVRSAAAQQTTVVQPATTPSITGGGVLVPRIQAGGALPPAIRP